MNQKIELIVVIDAMPGKGKVTKRCNKMLVQHVKDISCHHTRAEETIRTAQRHLSGKLLHTNIPEEEVQRILNSIEETQEKLFSAQNAADKAKEQFLLSNAAMLKALGPRGDINISQQHFHASGK